MPFGPSTGSGVVFLTSCRISFISSCCFSWEGSPERTVRQGHDPTWFLTERKPFFCCSAGVFSLWPSPQQKNQQKGGQKSRPLDSSLKMALKRKRLENPLWWRKGEVMPAGGGGRGAQQGRTRREDKRRREAEGKVGRREETSTLLQNLLLLLTSLLLLLLLCC